MKRAIAAGALALVSAATCLVLAPAASAAPDACVTNTLTTGPNEGVGTQVTKSSTSTCSDLNLVYAHDGAGDGYDAYAGRLYHTSTGSWKTCNAGYIGVLDGTYAVDRYLLCTDVNDGTRFTVASKYDYPDTVKITH